MSYHVVSFWLGGRGSTLKKVKLMYILFRNSLTPKSCRVSGVGDTTPSLCDAYLFIFLPKPNGSVFGDTPAKV
jgi:hypothetical protein